jgi:hypothetical protein
VITTIMVFFGGAWLGGYATAMLMRVVADEHIVDKVTLQRALAQRTIPSDIELKSERVRGATLGDRAVSGPLSFNTNKEALMSQVLYALVILQGTSGLAFEPGYSSKEQCLSVYRGQQRFVLRIRPERRHLDGVF